MSSDLAIRLEEIGKRYRLGESTGVGRYKYRTIREDISGLFRRRRTRTAEAERHLWALRNVSLEIGVGDTVGIIGRNGAGKSTLLKILARITPPTAGRGVTRGRVGSLLEVGTGFHPELTGKENIELAAAIMGMSRSDLATRYDDIVEFSGLAKFLDTPVKRFSSGMYMRLAFSVAAHLEPEILLVDEVLAVGDSDFQKKCLGRMSEIGGGGRTVVFVSHSMPSILRLCPRVILLDSGGVVADGRSAEVVRTYLESGLGSTAERVWESPETAPGDAVVRLRAVRVRTASGAVSEEVDIREPVRIEIDYWHIGKDPSLRPFVNLQFFNEDGVCLFVTADYLNREWLERDRHPGVVTASCEIPGNYLAEGRVSILAAISSMDPVVVHAKVTDAVSFQVIDRSQGDGARGRWVRNLPGVVRPMLPWDVEVAHEPMRLSEAERR